MVTIRIKGGLGNQLFQYAAGYALAKRMNQKLKLDSSFFPQQTLRGFKLGYLNVTFGDVVEHQSGLVKAYKNKYLNKTLRKANVRALPCGKQTKYLLETRSDIVPEFFNISAPNIYLDGYYQSEKYFREYKADLIQQFTPNYPSEAEYESALAEIQGREAVAVHVRRGDFLNAQNDRLHYAGICTMQSTLHRHFTQRAIIWWWHCSLCCSSSLGAYTMPCSCPCSAFPRSSTHSSWQ